MPATYKLTYFNIRGRAELSRLIFAAAGQKFEDERIDSAKWEALKPTTPFGSMPILEIKDGAVCEVVTQSMAIARFLASRFGLAGQSEIERLRSDEAAEIISELFDMLRSWSYAKEPLKSELERDLKENKFPAQCVKFKKLFDRSSQHYLANKKLSYADLWLFTVLEFVAQSKLEIPEFLKEFMENIKTNEKSSQHANITKYLKTRPPTPT